MIIIIQVWIIFKNIDTDGTTKIFKKSTKFENYEEEEKFQKMLKIGLLKDVLIYEAIQLRRKYIFNFIIKIFFKFLEECEPHNISCKNCKKYEIFQFSKFKLCSNCKNTFYCCFECQKINWEEHKINCKKI
jgi:hypothetical protein